MLRNIGAVVIGILSGALTVFLVERIGHTIFPPPAGVDTHDPEQLAAVMDAIPFGAKLAVVIGWFLGVLVGASAASLVARKWAPAAWVVAGTLGLMTALTLAQIPHPAWMVFGAMIAIAAGGWIAVRLTGAKYGKPPVKPDPMPGL